MGVSIPVSDGIRRENSHKSAYEALPAKGAQHFTKEYTRLTSSILRASHVAANVWRFSHHFYAIACNHVFFRLRVSNSFLKSSGRRARAHSKKMPGPKMQQTIPDAPCRREPGDDFSRFRGRTPTGPQIPRLRFPSEKASVHPAVLEKDRRVAPLVNFAPGLWQNREKPFQDGLKGDVGMRGIGRGLSKNICMRPPRPKRARTSYLKKMLNRRDATNGFATSLPRLETGQTSHRKFRTRARSGIILAAIWKNEASPSKSKKEKMKPPAATCAAYIGQYACGFHAMKRITGIAGDPGETPIPLPNSTNQSKKNNQDS
jgi:hypothetical protein